MLSCSVNGTGRSQRLPPLSAGIHSERNCSFKKSVKNINKLHISLLSLISRFSFETVLNCLSSPKLSTTKFKSPKWYIISQRDIDYHLVHLKNFGSTAVRLFIPLPQIWSAARRDKCLFQDLVNLSFLNMNSNRVLLEVPCCGGDTTCMASLFFQVWVLAAWKVSVLQRALL